MFKHNWESISSQDQPSKELIMKMVGVLRPGKMVRKTRLLPGGHANHNIYIEFAENQAPFILRIYARDKDAVYKEEKISKLVSGTIPTVKFIKIASSDKFVFAACDIIPGISLSQLLLTENINDLKSVIYEVGILLADIGRFHFKKAGFFDKNLEVGSIPDDLNLCAFAKRCLEEPHIQKILPNNIATDILRYIDIYSYMLPTEREKHLVHGDFDPSNIFVNKDDGEWAIVAILDWEFSFSGSPLWDVANMLRYANRLPSLYEQSFIHGFSASGGVYPDNWRVTIALLNILALLDCLKRSDSHLQPKRCDDIKEQIIYFVNYLKNFEAENKVVVVSFNEEWSQQFLTEAIKIQKVLGNNCLEVHHIGSTSIPKLSAKPIIDMIPVVKDITAVDLCNQAMEALGYTVKGEFGFFLRRFFVKQNRFHVHVFEQGNPEIERHLRFRDWLQSHDEDA